MNIKDAYRRYRRSNPTVPAGVAYAIVRHQNTMPTWAEGFDVSASGEEWTGEVDGWEITIQVEVQQDPDISWAGEFTDDPTDAVPNPEYQHGRYKYFRPASEGNTFDDYRRAGLSKSEAREAMRKADEQLAKTALEPQYFVTVVAARDGVRGSAALGGTYLDDGPYAALWTAEAHDMIGEAISEGKSREPSSPLRVRLADAVYSTPRRTQGGRWLVMVEFDDGDRFGTLASPEVLAAFFEAFALAVDFDTAESLGLDGTQRFIGPVPE